MHRWNIYANFLFRGSNFWSGPHLQNTFSSKSQVSLIWFASYRHVPNEQFSETWLISTCCCYQLKKGLIILVSHLATGGVCVLKNKWLKKEKKRGIVVSIVVGKSVFSKNPLFESVSVIGSSLSDIGHTGGHSLINDMARQNLMSAQTFMCSNILWFMSVLTFADSSLGLGPGLGLGRVKVRMKER